MGSKVPNNCIVIKSAIKTLKYNVILLQIKNNFEHMYFE